MGGFDSKAKRHFALAVAVITALLLVGVLPQFGISLSQQLFGLLNVGMAIGLANFATAFFIWKKHF